jgi:hypothetical protein
MTSKFSVNLDTAHTFDISLSSQINNINNLSIKTDYYPLDFSNTSNYYPTLDLFDYSHNLTLNSNKHIINYNTAINSNNENENINVFFKFAPLLDTTRYMIGKYKSKYNASYTDNFASFLISKLLSHHNFINGNDYFGSFLAIQKKYIIDIGDELEYLYDSDFFRENLDKLFHIEDKNNISNFDFLNYGSRSNKPKLNISDIHDNLLIIEDIEDIEDIEHIDIENIENIYEKQNNNDGENDNSEEDDDDNSEEDDDDNSEEEDDDNSDEEPDEEGEDDEDDEDDDEDDEEDTPVYAYIDNFPVQVICIEKCHGTFDALLENDSIDIDSARSILFQVIMILITLQKTFHLTHNDLHTNNIMYSNTDKEFLYYKYDNIFYKVPTYGKIVKIIDFGRSIYKYNGELFCSDSYNVGGDAHTQYNTEPFFDNKKARLDPNYSFDLCRLGCSIYDFIIPDDTTYEELDDFQKIINDWCTDDHGRNILYKKNGEERYPDFKLYKMIARTVHKHTPQEQLSNSYFSFYKIDETDEKYFDIDSLPVYA